MILKYCLSFNISNQLLTDQTILIQLCFFLSFPNFFIYLCHTIKFCIIAVISLSKYNDPANFKDLCPISLKPVMFKILKIVIIMQIVSFSNQNLILRLQTGLRSNFSCLVGLNKITDDIFSSSDMSVFHVLVLLDFSRAFDIINHKLLLSILYFCDFDVQAIFF